ncbi:MAG: ester cyclase [Gemmatimonadales bacterium]
MTADPKTTLFRWFREVWNEGRHETIDELMLPDCLTKVEGLDAPLSRDAFKAYHRAFLSAVPDLRAEVLSVTTEGETSVASWRARGTHLGPGLGIPPSRRPVDFTGLSVFDFVDGRIAKGFDRWNRGEMIASLMQVRMDELREHAGLTQREAQVALLMAERFSHPEIATQLGIKPNTARRHCERVLSKLGVRRRQDVAQALGKIPGSVLDRHGSDL